MTPDGIARTMTDGELAAIVRGIVALRLTGTVGDGSVRKLTSEVMSKSEGCSSPTDWEQITERAVFDEVAKRWLAKLRTVKCTW